MKEEGRKRRGLKMARSRQQTESPGDGWRKTDVREDCRRQAEDRKA